MKIVILDLTRHSTNNGVCVVKWQATKKLKEYEATLHGAEVFHPDPKSKKFIPYEKLSVADVTNWLKNKKGWIESTNATLDANIERQVNPPILQGLPWQSDEAE